jgi:hypothetical protein
MNNSYRNTPWIFWPVRLLFELIEVILKGTGRLVAAVIGFTILIVGVVLTMTILAAPIGIPMIVFGFLLMVRGIF